MARDQAIWHLRGEGELPAGPHTAGQIVEWLRADLMDERTRCRRAGTADWRLVGEFRPFAAAIREVARRKARLQGPSRAPLFIAVATFVAALVASPFAYRLLTDRVWLRDARALFDSGEHDKTSRVLAKVLARHPEHIEASFLMGVTGVKQFAVGGKPEPLARGTTMLRRACLADPAWRGRAEAELAEVAKLVPSGPGRLGRIVAIAQLRGKLDLADREELAAQLWSEVRARVRAIVADQSKTPASRSDRGAAPVTDVGAAVALAVTWDSGLAADLVEELLSACGPAPDKDDAAVKLAGAVRQLATGRPDIRDKLIAALLAAGIHHTEAGRRERAEICAAAVAVLQPGGQPDSQPAGRPGKVQSAAAQTPTPPAGTPGPAPTARSTPPSPTATPKPKPALPDPEVATTPERLGEILDRAKDRRVLWVRLPGASVKRENLIKLRDWVRQGGVLWTETDLVGKFKFTNVRETVSKDPTGTAVAAKVNHPIVSGLGGQKVGYKLHRTRMAIVESLAKLPPGLTPLLASPVGSKAGRKDVVNIVCAIRKYGDGHVIFRPATIDVKTPAGKQFNENLKAFSFNPKPAPSRK